MATTAAVQGIKEAAAAFQRIEPVMRERIGDATDTTGKEIVRIASSRVPVRYGNLKKFIAMRFSKRTGIATVGIRAGTAVIPSGFEGVGPGGKVVTPARYAHLVHWGTSRQRGVPFMLQAAESQKAPYAQRVKAAGREAERDLAAVGGRSL
jgi:HK97 gp10 family phage protein